MPEVEQPRLKTGQPELLEDEILQGVDTLHFSSNAWQARGLHLSNGLPSRPSRNRSSYSTQGQNKETEKAQGSDICTPQLFSMAGGSEDLWADTSPWMLPGTDLFAPFPPWSGVQGSRLTQGPLRTISKQWRNATHHFWNTHTQL